jgi:hypothetical protein
MPGSELAPGIELGEMLDSEPRGSATSKLGAREESVLRSGTKTLMNDPFRADLRLFAALAHFTPWRIPPDPAAALARSREPAYVSAPNRDPDVPVLALRVETHLAFVAPFRAQWRLSLERL